MVGRTPRFRLCATWGPLHNKNNYHVWSLQKAFIPIGELQKPTRLESGHLRPRRRNLLNPPTQVISSPGLILISKEVESYPPSCHVRATRPEAPNRSRQSRDCPTEADMLLIHVANDSMLSSALYHLRGFGHNV